MEQLASAADGRGGGARQGAVFRGGSGGGGSRSYSTPRSGGFWQRSGGGSYGRQGTYVRGGSYGRHGGYDRRGSYYGGSGYRHGGYYGYKGHDGHHDYVSTSIWFGPSWGWGYWDPFYYPYYPYYPYYYRYPYYGPSTTVVIPQEPQEYIMKSPAQEETGYWYFCKQPKGYYPYVERCPGGWMKVVPQEPPDADEE